MRGRGWLGVAKAAGKAASRKGRPRCSSKRYVHPNVWGDLKFQKMIFNPIVRIIEVGVMVKRKPL